MSNFMSWLKFVVQWIAVAILILVAVIILAWLFLAMGNLLVGVGLFIVGGTLIFNFILFYKKQKSNLILSIIAIAIGTILIIVGWGFRIEEYKNISLFKDQGNFIGSVNLDLSDSYFLNREKNSDKVGFAIKSSGLGCFPEYQVIIEHNSSTRSYRINESYWQKNQSFIYNINSIGSRFFSSFFCGGGSGFGKSMSRHHNLIRIIPIDFHIDSGIYKFKVVPLFLGLDTATVSVINYQ